MTSFYRVTADPNATDRWYLRGPVGQSGNEIDPRLFVQGVKYREPCPLTVPLRRRGKPMDFNFADFDMIVASTELIVELRQILNDSLQCIPVHVEDAEKAYEIINVLDMVTCLDKTRSELLLWTGQDGRPEKMGGIRMITRLTLDSSLAYGHDLFRVAEWPVALIASSQIKSIIEGLHTSGIAFEELT